MATRRLVLPNFLLPLLIKRRCAKASSLCLCQPNKHDMHQGDRDQDFFTRSRQDTRLGGKPNEPQPEVERRPGKGTYSSNSSIQSPESAYQVSARNDKHGRVQRSGSRLKYPDSIASEPEYFSFLETVLLPDPTWKQAS